MKIDWTSICLAVGVALYVLSFALMLRGEEKLSDLVVMASWLVFIRMAMLLGGVWVYVTGASCLTGAAVLACKYGRRRYGHRR